MAKCWPAIAYTAAGNAIKMIFLLVMRVKNQDRKVLGLLLILVFD